MHGRFMALAARRTAGILGALGVLATLAPHAGRAQTVTGGFEDASTPRRGELRIQFGALFDGAKDQFGALGRSGSGKTPLGAGFSFDTLGALQIPAIGLAQRALQDSLGVSTPLSLGNVRSDQRILITRIPLRFDFGITSRISLAARIPVVRTRSTVRVSVNAGGGTGNLGFNPTDPRFTSGPKSTAANSLVQSQLTAAVAALNAAINQCTPTSPTPVCTNTAAARQLVTQATSTRNGLAAVYGTSAVGSGSPFVPIAGSDAQRAVEARLKSLRTQFSGFGVTSLDSTTIPTAATARIANTGLRRILEESTLGFGVDTIYSVERGGTGDIEAGVRFKLIDTFADSGAPGVGVHLRATATAGYQMGTLGTKLPNVLFDVPLGTAARGIVVRGEGDIGLGRRFTATFAARVMQPAGDEQTLRIPYLVGSILSPASREQTVSRTPGREIHVELTPRFAPSAAFALAAHYELTSRQADEYRGTFSVLNVPYVGTDAFDASTLGIGTGGREQRAGFAATYSTLPAYARRGTGLPVEISFVHSAVVAGSNGVIPRYTTDGLLVRYYTRIFGAGRRPR